MSITLTPDQLAAHADRVRSLAPADILAWTLAEFPGRALLSVSFGGGGLVLAHLLSRIDRTVPIVFLDTGLHFPETYVFKQQFAERYGLRVLDAHPASDPGPLYETDPDACCHIRKVEPMQRMLAGYDAWISAVRRDQSAVRGTVDVLDIQRVEGRDVLKVYPLAGWTRKEVWSYLHANQIPYHPLLDRGYSSIGCWPCTRPTADGEDERAGRWSGRGKTECGLHAFHDPSSSSRNIS